MHYVKCAWPRLCFTLSLLRVAIFLRILQWVVEKIVSGVCNNHHLFQFIQSPLPTTCSCLDTSNHSYVHSSLSTAIQLSTSYTPLYIPYIPLYTPYTSLYSPYYNINIYNTTSFVSKLQQDITCPLHDRYMTVWFCWAHQASIIRSLKSHGGFVRDKSVVIHRFVAAVAVRHRHRVSR